MSKFKPGDRVMRVCGVDFPQFNMKRGGLYTVSKHNYMGVFIKESSRYFDADFFELAENEFEGNV